VVLEALACGTPVIAMPAPGGTQEIIESVAACQLAESVSAESLAVAIRAWHARQPGRVGAEAVAAYAAGPIVRRYEAAMLRVMTEAA
jgi:glycosyltransferase involved in cell wall biosynthesis